MPTSPLPHTGSHALPSEATMRGALIAIAVTYVAIGLFQTVDPGGFVRNVGPFGLPNDHYVRDVATWYLAFGAVLLLAVVRPGWRVPLLALGIVQGGLHVINHIVDVGEADPVGVGIFNIVSLAAVLGVMVWLLAAARRAEVAATSPSRTGNASHDRVAGA